MQSFLSDDFLLQTDTARELYHVYAEHQPIFDYHCHLPVREIAGDINFSNLTKIWLNGDHYKWRAMRANGIDEKFITGSASDEEKFMAWAGTVPKTLRNPLYHWTHLELKNPFGITDILLNSDTAEAVYNQCNEMLARPEFSTCGLLKQMNVKVVCTTDDPVDNLEYHRQIAADGICPAKVVPAFRPDKAMAVEDPVAYNTYLGGLEKAADIDIVGYVDLLTALEKRHDFFHANGCRLSDHGLEQPYSDSFSDMEIEVIFSEVRSGAVLDSAKERKLKSAILLEMARMDARKNWTQQFHFGALRNTNDAALMKLGPDTGYDSIGDFEIGKPLAAFFNTLATEGNLAKTILYNVNPRDNELLAAMAGNYQDGSVPGKMQFGSAWWFNDQKDGMERQINALSNMGLLSRFVGMLTDSRSFLSYPRHDYFRRILCNLFGGDIENGELPNERELIGQTISDICFSNACAYFGISVDL
ncbi:MAG: glucuronate isomerase [Desulfocapsaceae bacterium]|jgi:glucuronate isomerase|nr:glucuronate isomerase [Desulfocapsaceae bacterium]